MRVKFRRYYCKLIFLLCYFQVGYLGNMSIKVWNFQFSGQKQKNYIEWDDLDLEREIVNIYFVILNFQIFVFNLEFLWKLYYQRMISRRKWSI